MTAKTESGANRRNHEMKETVKAKTGENRPSEEMKETAKATVGANRPSEILKEAVKPTTIPDPQDRPRVAEIPKTVTRQDAISLGRHRVGPDPRRKTRKKALIISTATLRKITEVDEREAPRLLRRALVERNALLRLVLDFAPERTSPLLSRTEVSQSEDNKRRQRHWSRWAKRSGTKRFFPNCLVGVQYDADLLDW
jgi:hypothetical protein